MKKENFKPFDDSERLVFTTREGEEVYISDRPQDNPEQLKRRIEEEHRQAQEILAGIKVVKKGLPGRVVNKAIDNHNEEIKEEKAAAG